MTTLSKLGLAAATLLLISCSGGETPAPLPDEVSEPVAEQVYDLELPTVEYTWDPQAGDPSVSAELGGPGFTGEGWESNFEFPQIANPDAPQGGSLIRHIEDWPATLRQAGKDWNSFFNFFAWGACYQSLLDVHQGTLELRPVLATHWQISEDKTTYRFRINPEARWSDGTEVTAADVVATWKLRVDPTLLEPASVMIYGKLEQPVALSKYIVEVKVKEESWRNFLDFARMPILPAAEVSIPGSEYLDTYQFAYTAVSGPYIIRAEDIDTGKSITITRRDDWWAEDNPAFNGWYNISSYRWVVVKEPALAFEKFKKGELDYLWVQKSQWWAQDLPEVEAVKRGLIVPRKFFNEVPIGTSGVAINQTRPHLDDVRVRKALQYLYDRETMIEDFFGEYRPLNSYFQGGLYQNPDNEPIGYDEWAAVELLEEAGWTETNAEGYRVKDGKELGFSLTYSQQLSERDLTIFQESCKRAGIRIELQLLTQAARWKNLGEKEFELASMAWSANVFPDPKTVWHSELAAILDNANITGFADPRVDALIEEYEHEYDVQRRAEVIREIDGIVYNAHPYVLGWYSGHQRVAYWNKYRQPEAGVPRFKNRDEMHFIWWVDPELEVELEAAKADTALTMEAPPPEHHFWGRWVEAQAAADGSE